MEHVEEILNEIRNRIQCLVSLCESPIEKLFLSNFLKQYVNVDSFGAYDLAFQYGFFYDELVHDLSDKRYLPPPPSSDSFKPYQPGVFCSGITIIASSRILPVDAILGIEKIDIFPQSTITVNDKKYRVDFELTYTLSSDKGGKKYNIVIECDGHEFHEKTKEQATRDKQRDRALQSKGYIVLRYSGSEIYFNRNYAEFVSILKEIETVIAVRYQSDKSISDAQITSGEHWKVS